MSQRFPDTSTASFPAIRAWTCIDHRSPKRMPCRSSRRPPRRVDFSPRRLPATFPGLTRHSPMRISSRWATRFWRAAMISMGSQTAASTTSRPVASIRRLSAPDGSGTLDAAQVDGARRTSLPDRGIDSARQLYSSWYWDPGIAATAGFISWRNWKMGAFNPTTAVPTVHTSHIQHRRRAKHRARRRFGAVPVSHAAQCPDCGWRFGDRRGVRARRAHALHSELQLRSRCAADLRDERASTANRPLNSCSRVRPTIARFKARRQQAHRLHRRRRSGVLREVPRGVVPTPGPCESRLRAHTGVCAAVLRSRHAALRRWHRDRSLRCLRARSSTGWRKARLRIASSPR